MPIYNDPSIDYASTTIAYNAAFNVISAVAVGDALGTESATGQVIAKRSRQGRQQGRQGPITYIATVPTAQIVRAPQIQSIQASLLFDFLEDDEILMCLS